jgi:MFS family permease
MKNRSFIIMLLGVAFEHLDMMLVSLLASSIVMEFVGQEGNQLLYAYIGYAIAFLFRPLGAFIFGSIGDLYGRKVSLIISMLLMSLVTLCLAFIPGVKVLGISATILFLLCRIGQGLAVGGEYGTAMTYAYELNPKCRSFFGAFVVSSTHVGGVFAGFLASKYVENFRAAFLIAGIVGLSLLFFRSLMQEYYVPEVNKLKKVATESLKNKKAILEAVLVASMLVLVFYGSLIYLNEIVYADFGVSRQEIFKHNEILLFLWIILPPCFGYFADKMFIPYRRIMRFGALGVFLSAPLLGLSLVSSSYLMVFATQVLLNIFHMMFCLCTPRFFGDLFAGHARNTAIATSYSLGASFTAALAPMICHINVSLFHTNFAICLPFMLIALAVFFTIKKENSCSEMILLNSMILK